MKKCSVCHEYKQLMEFQVRIASNDGLTAACKSCLKERDNARYEKNKDKRLASMKKYMQTEAGREAHARAVKKWQSLNQKRRAANVILNHALRDGKVAPLPCFICGAKAVAHHPDYDRPLDVVWLCQAHHKQAHALAI